MNQRPSAVTLLAFTVIVAGILTTFNGVGLISSLPVEQTSVYDLADMKIQSSLVMIPSVIYGLGIGAIMVGLASLMVARGLYKGYGWAWSTMVIFASVGIGIFAVMFATLRVSDVANIVINGTILAYLFAPHVRLYFGKVNKPKGLASK